MVLATANGNAIEHIHNSNVASLTAASTAATIPNGTVAMTNGAAIDHVANHHNYHHQENAAAMGMTRAPFHPNAYHTTSNFTQSFYQSESQCIDKRILMVNDQQYGNATNELMTSASPMQANALIASNPFSHDDIEHVEIILHDDNNIDEECSQIQRAATMAARQLSDDADDSDAYSLTHRDSTVEWMTANMDDSSSVEEALRALDIAISGDNDEYADTDEDDTDPVEVEKIELHAEQTPSAATADAQLHQALTKFLGQRSANQSNIADDTNDYDNISVDDTKPNVDVDADASTTLQPPSECESNMNIIAEVHAQSKELIDDVIAKCELYVNEKRCDIDESTVVTNCSNSHCNTIVVNANECGGDATQIIVDSRTRHDADAKQMPCRETCSTNVTYNGEIDKCDTIHGCTSDTINIENYVAKNESSLLLPMPDMDDMSEPMAGGGSGGSLDASIDDTFYGNVVASTPCVKLKISPHHVEKPGLMRRLSDNATDTAETNVDVTYTAANERTYDQEAFAGDNATFCMPMSDVSVIIMEPTQSKLDRDDINSDDLNTATPLNTPSEINYANFTWDKVKGKHIELDAPRMVNYRCVMDGEEANATANGDGTFVKAADSTFDQLGDGTFVQARTQAFDGTFEVGDWKDDEDDDDDDDDDITYNADEANMNFTLSELRKQLTLSLPHASGMQGMMPAEGDDFESKS